MFVGRSKSVFKDRRLCWIHWRILIIKFVVFFINFLAWPLWCGNVKLLMGMSPSNCSVVICDLMNRCADSRDGKFYFKDQNPLRGSLVTKRGGIFRSEIAKGIGSLYLIGCKEYKQSPSSSFFLFFVLDSYGTYSRWVRILAAWSHGVQLSAPYHPFTRKGTSSGPGAPMGQTGLATFSCSRKFWLFWGLAVPQIFPGRNTSVWKETSWTVYYILAQNLWMESC